MRSNTLKTNAYLTSYFPIFGSIFAYIFRRFLVPPFFPLVIMNVIIWQLLRSFRETRKKILICSSCHERKQKLNAVVDKNLYKIQTWLEIRSPFILVEEIVCFRNNDDEIMCDTEFLIESAYENIVLRNSNKLSCNIQINSCKLKRNCFGNTWIKRRNTESLSEFPSSDLTVISSWSKSVCHL